MRKRAMYFVVVAGFLSGSSARSMQLFSWAESLLHTFCPLCFWDHGRQMRALKAAIETDDYQRIRFLMRRRGLSPNTLLFGYGGKFEQDIAMPLVFAASLGHVASVDELLKAGADPNSQIRGEGFCSHPSALIAVCNHKGLDPKTVALSVSRLLAQGANPRLEHYQLDHDEVKKDESPVQKIGIEPQKRTKRVDALMLAKSNGYHEAASIVAAYLKK